jgi:hypothetical protein
VCCNAMLCGMWSSSLNCLHIKYRLLQLGGIRMGVMHKHCNLKSDMQFELLNNELCPKPSWCAGWVVYLLPGSCMELDGWLLAGI